MRTRLLPTIFSISVGLLGLGLANGQQRGMPAPKGRDSLPQKDFMKSAEDLFRRDCAGCHGVDGQGTYGNFKGAVKPQDLTATEWDPAYVLKVLDSGIPGTQMKSFNQLSQKEKVSLAFFVNQLFIPEPEPSGSGADALLDLGQEIYTKKCQSCHGINGDGKGRGAAGLKPPPAPFKHQRPNLETIVRTLDKGVTGTAMAPFHKLGITEKYAVGVFVQTLYRENGPLLPGKE